MSIVRPDADAQDDSDASERTFKRERAGGNYGAGTKEVQVRFLCRMHACSQVAAACGVFFWRSCSKVLCNCCAATCNTLGT